MKFALAACAAVLIATPALAAPGSEPLSADSAVLSLRGLDLTSVDGQRRLAIRMENAASAVCGRGTSTIHLALDAQARECRADVMADIRTRVASATAARDPGSNTQLAMR
ncbi:UrcA family protein [Sphingomonas aerophila]|uniref:UrcA family protein n=1 Tax=Sphingomonas aerophila TaxID=1344948 RepID=A0A7W9BAV0_9SPHN|nr:UrcA family protein [Sphingomonas aerophila]MBB5713829.1 UrcA family protein [Sphingomonas aerophila]